MPLQAMTTESMLSAAAQTLHAAADIFKGPASTGSSLPSRTSWCAITERLKGDVGKVGVLWTSGGQPSTDVAEGVLDALLQTSVATCTLCHLFTNSAGPTLRESLTRTAMSLVEPCVALVQALAQPDATAIKSQVAKVWAACDAAARTPLDNRSAVFKTAASVITVLQDTLREADELSTSASTAQFSTGIQKHMNGHKDGFYNSGSNSNGERGAPAARGSPTACHATDSDDGSADDNDMLDFGQLSAPELLVVNASRQLLDASIACLKDVIRPLLQGPPLVDAAVVESWESVLFHCRALQRCAEDLGAGLYPPQDGEEVASAAASLYDCMQLLVDERGEADAGALTLQLEPLRQRLELAHQQLAVTLSGLEEDQ